MTTPSMSLLRNADNQEITRMLDSASARSPVIRELCARLDAAEDVLPQDPESETFVQPCPVCSAVLTGALEIDQQTQQYKLRWI